MAKRIPAPRRAAGPVPAGAAAQSDAVGKFDKFATFALALPCTVLALVGLFIGVNYTSNTWDVGLFGFPGKVVADWETGPESLSGATAAAITGFEAHDEIGRTSDGEVDVAVLNIGYDQRVNLGDVFVLEQEPSDVRLEFVVFDVQANVSRAYILLGQNVEGGRERSASLKRSDMVTLCGGNETNIKVKRPYSQQIIRRYVESRGK